MEIVQGARYFGALGIKTALWRHNASIVFAYFGNDGIQCPSHLRDVVTLRSVYVKPGVW